jgi:hypothetical protein
MNGREATTAHPLCTCREHDHKLDARHCIGPQFTYRRADGTEDQGTCRILGGIEPSTRDSCVMHGVQS